VCGRFDTSHLTWAEIHAALETYSKVVTAPLNIEPNDDERPTTKQVTARLGDDGGWVLEKMRWGLVPFWRNGKPIKDTEKGANDGWKMTTFNARCEGVATASTFKGAFARRRCIIPANSWFEWTGEKGSKTKHTFRRADGGVIWFGGIWDRVTTPDEGEVASFSIITSESQGWLADYHTRAPMILEQDEWGRWLDPTSDPETIMRAVRSERFEIAG
jgi:putative SOS response-associated peptidase YedK